MKKNYKLFSFGLIALAINSVSAQCPTPTLVTATPSVICAGSTTSLNATALGSSINWFTVPVGGVSVGTSASATNFAISPTVTTTYYAESFGIGATTTQTLSYTGSLQTFTVPAGVTSLTIITKGAQGGDQTVNPGTTGGTGAIMSGNFTVTPGQVLSVMVGGQGVTAQYVGGGGGGSFVWTSVGSTLLSAAGGGGGAGRDDVLSTGQNGVNASIAASGNLGFTMSTGNGTGGSGGIVPSGYAGYAGGGAGWLSNGNVGTVHGCTFNSTGGTNPLSGGAAGIGGGSVGTAANGGYGGGGGGNARCGAVGGGGGGGYSGGGAGGEVTLASTYRAGGGGGSYNIGASQVNSVGKTGNGEVNFMWSAIGCASVSRTSVTVTVNAKPTVSVTSGAICTGGSYTFSPSGASTYSYSGGSAVVSPTANTSYSVTGTNSLGCVSSNTAVATITVNALPTVTANSGTICSGSSFTITGSGASTYSYSSGSVVSPTATATYTVSGTSTLGCVGSAVSSVTVNPSPLVSATSSSSLICLGQSAILTASTSATTYTWNTGATTATISVSPTVTSTYTVSSVGTNGCVGNGNVTVNVSACAGINEAVANSISVYPNPTSGLVNVILTSELSKNSTIEVYDAIGKLVVKQVLTSEANAVNISNLTNGIYTFKVLNNSNLIKIGKIVKQ